LFVHSARKNADKTEGTRKRWERIGRFGFDNYVKTCLMNFYRDQQEAIGVSMRNRCKNAEDPESALEAWWAQEEDFDRDPSDFINHADA
ncbi:hypothetical protein, partial [Sansalvadorimonas verongulae]|uniref:hypothetical protein n=1 Tax=Sansalvadorimonas verongulae TaxID=2172824 RepID=UPI0018AD11E5